MLFLIMTRTKRVAHRMEKRMVEAAIDVRDVRGNMEHVEKYDSVPKVLLWSMGRRLSDSSNILRGVPQGCTLYVISYTLPRCSSTC